MPFQNAFSIVSRYFYFPTVPHTFPAYLSTTPKSPKGDFEKDSAVPVN